MGRRQRHHRGDRGDPARCSRKVKLDKSHPQLGKPSLTVNHIRSFPDSTHTVQDRCEFTLDRRLLPGEDPNAAFAEIERIAKEVERIADPVSGKAYGSTCGSGRSCIRHW